MTNLIILGNSCKPKEHFPHFSVFFPICLGVGQILTSQKFGTCPGEIGSYKLLHLVVNTMCVTLNVQFEQVESMKGRASESKILELSFLLQVSRNSKY